MSAVFVFTDLEIYYYYYLPSQAWYTLLFYILECVSNLSSLLTTLNGSINVFIYFIKHRDFVHSLIFPTHQPSETNMLVSDTIMRRRSSWMLHRMPSKPVPLHIRSLSVSSSSSSPSPSSSHSNLLKAATASTPSHPSPCVTRVQVNVRQSQEMTKL